jgi:hypothetical protein
LLGLMAGDETKAESSFIIDDTSEKPLSTLSKIALMKTLATWLSVSFRFVSVLNIEIRCWFPSSQI